MLGRGQGVAPYRLISALALYTIPSQSTIGQWDWGFHAVRDCFDPGDLRFRPQVVGVVKVLKDF